MAPTSSQVDAAHDLGPRETYMESGSPVTKLFDDILAEMFLQIATDIRLRFYQRWWDRSFNIEVPGPFSWLPITHVCRHWRNIALASPPLWSHVDVRYDDRTATFIGRSGNAPLTIRHHWSSYTAGAIRLVFENISRVRVLELNSNNIPGSNPSLDVHEVYPDTLLVLKELIVPNVDLDWVKTIARSQLTHLRASNGLGTVHGWAELLSDLPNLLELSLDFVMQQTGDEVTAKLLGSTVKRRLEVINLPRLEYLHLSGENAGMAAGTLLRRLAFPSTTHVRFDAFWFGIQSDDIDACLPGIFHDVATGIARTTDGRKRVYPSLRASLQVGCILMLEAWPTLRTVQELNNLWDIREPGRVELALHVRPPHTVLGAGLAALPLEQVQVLAVVGLSHELQWTHFAPCTAVTELSVSYTRTAVTLATALAQPLESGGLLFPVLRRVTVAGAHWDRRFDAAGEEDGGAEGRTLAERLQAAFWQRREMGAPVHVLCVPWGENIDGEPTANLEASGAVTALEWHEGVDDPAYEPQRESVKEQLSWMRGVKFL